MNSEEAIHKVVKAHIQLFGEKYVETLLSKIDGIRFENSEVVLKPGNHSDVLASICKVLQPISGAYLSEIIKYC